MVGLEKVYYTSTIKYLICRDNCHLGFIGERTVISSFYINVNSRKERVG